MFLSQMIAKTIPFLDFINVLEELNLTPEAKQKILDLPMLEDYKLAAANNDVRDFVTMLNQVYTVASDIKTRDLAKLIFGLLTEDIKKRIDESSHGSSAKLTKAKYTEIARLASELKECRVLETATSLTNFSWAEELSGQYLQACVNNRVWGAINLCCMVNLANAASPSEKTKAARDLMIVGIVQAKTSEHIRSKKGEILEVEVANLLLVKILDDLGKSLPTLPKKIAHYEAAKSLVTDKLVKSTHKAIKEITTEKMVDFLCNGVVATSWAKLAFPEIISQCEERRALAAQIVSEKTCRSQEREEYEEEQKKRTSEGRKECESTEEENSKVKIEEYFTQKLSQDHNKTRILKELLDLKDSALDNAATTKFRDEEISRRIYDKTLELFLSLSRDMPSEDSPSSSVRSTLFQRLVGIARGLLTKDRE